MIPKIIHYCWFGKGLMPQSQKDCIKSWKRFCPDYQIVKWDESNFDVNLCPYTSEAYKQKKWAFVADVARLKALDEMGGIYMDTDVELFGSLDRFLDNEAFSGIEIYKEEFERTSRHLLDNEDRPIVPGTCIQCCGFLSAVLGANKMNPLINDCLKQYLLRNPYRESGDFNSIVIDGLLADTALQYGFRFRDCEQDLSVVHLYPSTIFAFAGVPKQKESVAFHYTAWSWMPKTRKQKLFLWLDKCGILKPYRSLKKKVKSIFKVR